MALVRQKHWAERAFHDFLVERARMSFAWGTNDCCIFPADAIKVITGEDIAADFRGNYTDEASAFALVGTVAGGKTVSDAAAYCATKFAMTEWPKPLFAQRGDLVTLEDSGRMIAGIVGLNGQIVTVGQNGFMQRPITAVLRAWHY
jgi:hypothetical protein